MRSLFLARLDETRPVVLLTRETALAYLNRVTVAPIYTKAHGLSVGVPVGPANGLDHDCVVNCDNIVSILAADLGRKIGLLHDHQEPALAEAILSAFDLG